MLKPIQSNDGYLLFVAIMFILIIGFLALFHNFGLFEIFSIGKLWPLILVVIGIMIINRKNKTK